MLKPPPDVTLSTGSTALNRGVALPNINDGFTGAAPDLGALELGCALPLYGPRPAGVDESNEPLGCEPGAAPPPPPTGSAAFVKTDLTTQGNWKAAYGKDGAIVVGDSQLVPSYVHFTLSNAATYLWSSSTGDVRAPKRVASAERVAARWQAGGSFTIALDFTDGLSHQVAMYALDWDDHFGRTEKIEILDGNGAVLDSRSLSGFFGGQYLVWNLGGRITIRVTNTNAPSNAVISSLLFGGPRGGPAATFVKTDATTLGNWKAAYGSQGAIVVGDSSVLPAYATVSTAGNSTWLWSQSTGDGRALKRVASAERVAACWLSAGSFDITLDLTDGQPHHVALYALDWDYLGRTMTLEVLDSGGAVVDTRTLSAFTGGQFLVWNVRGKVTIRVTNKNGSPNAVISGLFISPGT